MAGSDRAPRNRWTLSTVTEIGRILLVPLFCALLCGWHYVRVWRHFGNPFIGVWDPKTGSLVPIAKSPPQMKSPSAKAQMNEVTPGSILGGRKCKAMRLYGTKKIRRAGFAFVHRFR